MIDLSRFSPLPVPTVTRRRRTRTFPAGQALAALLVLGGCQPSVDTYLPLLDRFLSPPNRTLTTDLSQCRLLAGEKDTTDLVLSETVFGTALGGTFGLLAGILFGSPNWGMGIGAAYGAAVGYAAGLGQATSARETIVGRCLEGRGYSVLAP